MSPLLYCCAALAGGLGAVLRSLVDAAVSRLTAGRFPWGIIVVNVTGSFALGVLTASLPGALPILGVGLLGGYTTFSTAMLDALELWQAGRKASAIRHLIGTFLACALAALAGIALGSLI